MQTLTRPKRHPLSAIEPIDETGRGCNFLITNEYKRFAEFCRNCAEERYIGLCSGPPGIGKTVAARFYAEWDKLLDYRHKLPSKKPAFIRHCRTIFYTPSITNSPHQVRYDLNQLRFRQSMLVKAALQELEPDVELNDIVELIIIDEADRLKFSTLEELRDIYDRRNVGMVFIGMPGLARRFSRFAQFYSRVGFVHEFKTVSTSDLKKLLDNKETASKLLKLESGQGVDNDAYSALARVTGGNFRLINRLSSQIQRVMKINHLNWVNREVIATARDSLLIGNG